jgi:hypothetical protein
MSSNLPQMPMSIKRGLLSDFVDVYGPCTEAPTEFLMAGFAAGFGLAFSPHVARNNLGQTQPRLYTCNIGRSGITRKSTASKAANSTITAAFGGPGLKLVSGFGSSEGILRILAEANHTPVLCYLDELEVLLRKTKIENSVGTAPLHILFEDNCYQHPLSKSSLSFDEEYLGIIANCTDDRFTDLWGREEIDAGFLSRWLLVTGETSKRIPRPPKPNSSQVQNLVNELITLRQQIFAQLKASGQTKILMDFADAAASQRWDDFYINEIVATDPAFIRIDTIGERLMMIVALAQSRFDIDLPTVEAVIEFLHYEVAVRKALNPVVGTEIAKVEQKIRVQFPSVGFALSRNEIGHRIHSERVGSELFKKALAGLAGEGFMSLQNGKYVRLA